MKIVEVKFINNISKIVTFTRDKDNDIIKRYHDFKHYFYVQDLNGDQMTLFRDKFKLSS